MAVASSTGTSSLPLASVFSPIQMYRKDFATVMTDRTFTGKNSLDAHRRTTRITSLSSYSRLSARPVCSGASASDLGES